MFFTQEDYRKIERWLQRNSVKDTEFQEALPLKGEETVAIVQDGHNKKVFIKDLVDQIFNLGVSDFLNVTDKYKASYITLKEAIKLIPARARKVGQVVTFLNAEGNWQVYQFKGALNQWNQLDLWEDLFDWEKIIINSILPDEEDLTKSSADENGNSYLSLKDREYKPEDFSGLGRVILRKNIIEVEDPIYGKVKRNVLYQDMINKSNTIYEIRYDFDLNGEEITIPKGCVLEFQGGSIRNGVVVGSNTMLNADCIVFYDIEIRGTWNVCKVSDILFYVEAGNSANNTRVLKSMFALANKDITNVITIDKEYLYESEYNTGIIIPSNTHVNGKGSIKVAPTEHDKFSIFKISDSENIVIEGLNLKGDLLEHLGTSGEWEYGIYVRGSKNVLIKNCELSYFWGDGIDIQKSRWFESEPDLVEVDYEYHCKNIVIDNCNVHHNRRNNISIEAAIGVVVRNSDIGYAGTINGTAPMYGIDIEPIPENNQIVKDVLIENCNIHDSNSHGVGIPLLTNYEGYISFKNSKIDNIVSWATNAVFDIRVENCEQLKTGVRSYLYSKGSVNISSSSFNVTFNTPKLISDNNIFSYFGAIDVTEGYLTNDKYGTFELSGSSNMQLKYGDINIIKFNREVSDIVCESCNIHVSTDSIIKFSSSILNNCKFKHCNLYAGSNSVPPFTESGYSCQNCRFENCSIDVVYDRRTWLPLDNFINCRINIKSIYTLHDNCYFENCLVNTDNAIILNDIDNMENVQYVFVRTMVTSSGKTVGKSTYTNSTYIKSVESIGYDSVNNILFTEDSVFTDSHYTKRNYHNYYKHSHEDSSHYVLIRVPRFDFGSIRLRIAPSQKNVIVGYTQEFNIDVVSGAVTKASSCIVSEKTISTSDVENLCNFMYKVDIDYIYLLAINENHDVNLDMDVDILSGTSIIQPKINMTPKSSIDTSEYSYITFSLLNVIYAALDYIKSVDVSKISYVEAIDRDTLKHYWYINSKWVDATGANV